MVQRSISTKVNRIWCTWGDNNNNNNESLRLVRMRTCAPHFSHAIWPTHQRQSYYNFIPFEIGKFSERTAQCLITCNNDRKCTLHSNPTTVSRFFHTYFCLIFIQIFVNWKSGVSIWNISLLRSNQIVTVNGHERYLRKTMWETTVMLPNTLKNYDSATLPRKLLY